MVNIIRETTDGYLHPFFNLHTASTFRSSSNSPNFQNFPIRDPWAAKAIRRAFIPRKGHRLVETDYGGIEVRVAACYHQDPRMLRYLETGYDMHREMAAECYCCDIAEVTKQMRYSAKNRFVFPEFYGSYYAQVAPELWNAITELNLKLESGGDLRAHLKKRGISDYEAYEDHIRQTERDFWHKKFKQYTQWKEDWLEAYYRAGYFVSKTGFRCGGWMKRNEVINYPIQGSAFHCLLWSFIELQKAMEKRKMRSVIVGQIHDSILADVHVDEFDEYVELNHRISTERLRGAWKWIILPLEVEVEASPPGGSWYEKQPIK
jgi:DNA polymerase-1